MGGGALLFNAIHGIRFRAQPTSPLGPRTGPSTCCIYRRDAVHRCLAIRSEANKGAQSRRNSKAKSELNSKLISETRTDVTNPGKELKRLLQKIEASYKRGPSVAERRIGGQKKQSLEPKSKNKNISFGHTEYTFPPSNLEILKKDDGNRAVPPSDYDTMFEILKRTSGSKAVGSRRNLKYSGPSHSDKMMRNNGDDAVAPSRNDIKSSGPPSNFDKMIRDDGDNAFALPHDYKPPRPPSRFVRRSPIPISSPAKEEAPLKQTMSLADNMRAIYNKPRALKPELKLDRNSMLKVKTTSKLRNKTKAEPKLKPNSELEAMTNSELRDVPKAGPELEPNSELETVTMSELRDIPKAEPELEPNSELETVTMSELRDIPKAEPELKPNSELEAVTRSQLRDIPKAEPELEAMTVSKLKDMAKARGLKGYSRLKKAKLVEVLKGTSL